MLKLSRSAVELSLNCQRCFILQYKFRVSLRSLPFTLNSAVDNLCKNEFDYYRNKEEPEPHPLFLENDGVTENLIDVVPFKHKDLDKWRNFRQGISFTDDKMGYTFYGAIDDVWIKKNGDLIISDVKSTSKKEFNWDKTWLEYEYPKAYKRQLEMYQWLFRKNGFSVSNKAYLVYYNGLKDEPMSDSRIKEQLDKLKAEQKAKSNKRKFVENYIKKNANRFEDKLTAVKITQKADQNLFANAIKELMKQK